MKTKQEKLEYIYEKIANKDLNFGCLFKYKDIDFAEFRICWIKEGWWIINWIEWGGLKVAFRENFINNTIIIWQPVMIGDVLNWIEDNLNNWYEKCYKCWADMMYEDLYYCSNEECENDDEPEDFVFLSKWDLVIENAWRDTRFINKDNFLWKKLNKPIEEQSDECIDFVYSLLEKKDKTFT